MILRRFPGVGPAAGENDFSCFHRENVIVYAETDSVSFGEHAAPLSVKACVKGSEIYELRGVPLAVEPGRCLTINNGQRYASYICSDSNVVSFCVFFRDGLETEVLRALDLSDDALADEPFSSGDETEFISSLTRPGSPIADFVYRMHHEAVSGRNSQLWIDERSSELAALLIEEHSDSVRQAESLDAVKPATRLEIYRRLCLARDYLESCYAENIDLKSLAAVACLSPHHFLRRFKEAFGLSPHRYLRSVRLRKAAEMLATGDAAVTEVCIGVGYSDPSSFSRLFRSVYGCSPSQFGNLHSERN